MGTFLLPRMILNPVHVEAYVSQPFPILIGTNLTPALIFTNITNFLMRFSVFVCIAVFILGAFYMVFSRGKEDLLQKGKDLMIGAMIGLAVILGAYAIIRTFFYVLYTI